MHRKAQMLHIIEPTPTYLSQKNHITPTSLNILFILAKLKSYHAPLLTHPMCGSLEFKKHLNNFDLEDVYKFSPSFRPRYALFFLKSFHKINQFTLLNA